MSFTRYSNYMEVVSSTNSIFDYWFFQKKRLDRNPKIFSMKKNIYHLPVQKQTESIITILENNDATKEIVDLFIKRKAIEENIFNKTIKKNNNKISSELKTLKKECDQTTKTLLL